MDIQYTGFDPVKTLSQFIALGNSSGRDVHADLARLLMLGIVRGTNTGEGAATSGAQAGMMKENTMSKKGMEMVKEFKRIYQLKPNKKAAKSPFDITIARLITSTAPIVANLLKEEKIWQASSYSRVPLKAHEGLGDPAVLPRHLRFPGSNSLYVDNEDWQAAYQSWARNFAVMINKNPMLSAENLEKLYNEAEKYSGLSRNSKILEMLGVNEEARKSIISSE